VNILENYTNYLVAQGLSFNTRKVYVSEFKSYINYFKRSDIRYISRDNIISYLRYLFDQGYSSGKVNQAINAIKFYKERVLREKRQTYFFKRPKQVKYLPNIISQIKMRDMIFSIPNTKHRAIIFVLYDNGLRISELINLRIMDVRTKCEHPHLIIRDSKGGKNRILPLSDECIEIIRCYYLEYKPKEYLFCGINGSYSKTSISKILKSACAKNEIKGRFRVHDLRHNFATHCLVNGTNIYHLSKYLGHKSVRTTEQTYAHLLPQNLEIKRCYLMSNAIELHKFVS